MLILSFYKPNVSVQVKPQVPFTVLIPNLTAECEICNINCIDNGNLELTWLCGIASTRTLLLLI